MFSGYKGCGRLNDRAHIESVLKLKAAGYLLKPIAKDALIAVIKKHI